MTRSSDHATVSHAHSGDTPLLDVVEQLEQDGIAGQFTCVEGALVKCLTCRKTMDASSLPADEMTRLEGESDPSDMMMVVPVSCPHCGAKGPLVLKFGPESSPEEADVLAALPRIAQAGSEERPSPGIVGDAPGGGAPGRP